MKIIRRSTATLEGTLVERLYQARGGCWETEQAFSIESLLKPESLAGLTDAVLLLEQALIHKKRILIVGDFDVDGACSTVLCLEALRTMGAQVDYLIQNRFEFGYGLTEKLVDFAIAHKQPELIITVDNGITNQTAVSKARDAGIAVIITDHHLPDQEIPDANAVINPNQPHCNFPSKATCGCAVAFYMIWGLRTHLKKNGWFENHSCLNLLNSFDLLALATVADVVPIDHNNRIFIERGLSNIRLGRSRPGIYALLSIARIHQKQFNTQDIAFYIAPRLNAAGRMDTMSIGVECLLAKNHTEALHFAQQLNQLNDSRKQQEKSMKKTASLMLKQHQLEKNNLPAIISLYDVHWHQGIVGILASRLKEQYYRPSIAFALESDQNRLLKGSARSVPGFSIRDAFADYSEQTPGIIKHYGGHAMAAGLLIEEKDFKQFQTEFNQFVQARIDPSLLECTYYSDGPLDMTSCTYNLAQTLKVACPWGKDFPAPVFDNTFKIISLKSFLECHISFVLEDINSKRQFEAIYFNARKDLTLNRGDQILCLFQLDGKTFHNIQKMQLIVQQVWHIATAPIIIQNDAALVTGA